MSEKEQPWPWPLLRQLRQGDIEQTALVDARGNVVARVSAPEAYQGDLRTAVERGDLTAEIVSASAAAPDLREALRMWVTIHGDVDFAAKSPLEQAEIRSIAWLNSIAALAKV